MRQIAKIGAWYLAFTLLCLACARYTIPRLPSSLIPNHSLPSRYITFNERLSAFKSAPPGRSALFGSSIVMQYGEFGNYHNLGIAATLLQEHRALIKRYCKPNDVPIYIFDLRDIALSSTPPRLTIINPFVQTASVAKLLVRYNLGFDDRPDFSVMEVKFDPLAPLYVAVCKSCGVPSLPNLRNVPLTRVINKLARPIDIAPLHEIQRINPNTVFVLAPVLPLADIDDDSDFGELINKVVSNQRSLEQSLADSGLHFINLSRAVPASMFLDYDHLTPEGRRIVRRLLSDLDL